MRLEVQHTVPPQFHFSLNFFVHFYALPTAGTNATQMEPEVHL